jgi:hypothetical protein
MNGGGDTGGDAGNGLDLLAQVLIALAVVVGGGGRCIFYYYRKKSNDNSRIPNESFPDST